MAEVSLSYVLATPAGTLTFNATSGDRYWLSNVSGMDSTDLRGGGSVLSQRDGGIAGTRFQQPLFITFEGQFVADTVTSRTLLEKNMRTYLRSLHRTDGTLTYTPTGLPARQRTVRLAAGPDHSGGYLKSFQFVLEAPDPLAYSTTLTTSANITVNGAAVNVTNGGDVATWPTLQLHGAVTNPIIKNNTTGKTLELDYSGLVVADGTYVEANTRNETVLLTTGVSKIGALDPLTSEFWQLAVGVNAIEVDGTSPGANAKGVVVFRDAYSG